MKALAAILLLAAGLDAQVRRPADEFPTQNGPLKIAIIRHASLMIEAGGQAIHVDPTGQGNYAGLPQADLILLTDVHGDHLDPAMIARLRKPNTKILAPAAVAKTVAEATVIRNGESTAFGRWTIEAVPMYNLQRGPAPGKLYHEKGRGNGYVLTYGGKRIYLSGDTEATAEMKALKEVDIAFVSMNLPYTMPPEEAAEGVRAFHPRIVYPYHYRGSDLSAFEKALAGTGIEVRIRDWYY
jgi:L-ascorbate metabolism protein UlaG (beta-lactamase superfamily)